MTKKLLLRLIALYQSTAGVRRARCRFHPTCSAYAAEAISSYGAARGSWLALRRLVKCQPFGPFGFDPVPDRETPVAEPADASKALSDSDV